MSPKIKDMTILERPREKMILNGACALSNVELIAILLSSGNKNESAIDVASKIVNLDKIDGIRGLCSVTIEELMRVDGIGKAKACQILACVEFAKRMSKLKTQSRKKIISPCDVAEFCLNELRFLKKEIFKVILLNTKSEIISDINISIGSLNSSIVHPREVFIEAIKRSASKVILVHNHPSGNPYPSTEDKNITKRLVECGNLIGIQVIDHVIIGDGNYISFKEKLFI